MWFLILALLVIVALVGILAASDLRRRRHRKAYGDEDFATRDRGGVDPGLRVTNEADLNQRSNGRLRELRNQPWGGEGTF